MAIKEIDSARYDQMLGALPPKLWLAFGFLVGEASDHRRCKNQQQNDAHLQGFLLRLWAFL